MCSNCRAFIENKDKVCPYCDAPQTVPAAQTRGSGEVLGGFIPHARFTTIMILLVNTALFAATLLADMQRGSQSALLSVSGPTLFQFGAKLSEAVLHGQWWRLVTAGFLHGGMMHILMNSWALMDLGSQVEELYGSRRLIVFYFVSTVFGFLASTYWSPSLSVGASAGIFGLIGAMIALGVRNNNAMGSAIRGMYMRWAIYGLLFGLIPGFHIDNAAHIGGLVAGFAAAYIGGEPKLSGAMENVWQVMAAMCLAITAFCFVRMFFLMKGSGG